MAGNRRQKVRIALVGAGRMGTRWAAAIANSSVAELVSVDDSNRDAAKRTMKSYGTPGSEAKAALIVVPHKWLAHEARRALKAGLHVLVEKPGAMSARAMRDLEKLAREKHRVLMVGFNYRYFAGIAKVKELVGRGAIGKPIALRIRHGHAGRAGYGKEWRMDPNIAGGGVLMDQGVHLVDLALWLLPSPKWRAVGETGNELLRKSAEDVAAVVMKNAGGQVVSLFADIAEWEPLFSLEVIGSKGICRMSGLGRKYGNGEIVELVKPSNRGFTIKRFRYLGNAEKPLQSLLVDFVSSIRGKHIGPSADDARRMLEVVEQIYRPRFK